MISTVSLPSPSPIRYLENWLHGISIVRNIAAHHNRLFQRTIAVTPVLPPALAGLWIDVAHISKQSTYMQFSNMAYLLQFISPVQPASLPA